MKQCNNVSGKQHILTVIHVARVYTIYQQILHWFIKVLCSNDVVEVLLIYLFNGVSFSV